MKIVWKNIGKFFENERDLILIFLLVVIVIAAALDG